MNTFVSHASALQYWRFHDPLPPCVRVPSRHFEDAAPMSPHEAHDASSAFPELDLPIHMLFSHKDKRVRSDEAVAHVCTQHMPPGSFLSAAKDIAVCSPELVFTQMAEASSDAALIKLGFELCGAYALQPTSDFALEGFRARSALTSRARLKSFAERAQGVRGRTRAKRLAAYIANGSASPMETVLAMTLGLPCRFGGYGLGMPHMNYRINTGTRGKTISAKQNYFCDLYWPDKKVAVEYDSNIWHTGAQRIADDAKRRNALEHLGVSVIVVTSRQLFSANAMDEVSSLLQRQLGRRVRPRGERWYEKRQELRDELLKDCRPNA